MHEIIICKDDMNKYHPLLILSELDTFEVNLKKYNKPYIYVDNFSLFRQTYSTFPDHCVFILDKNVKVDFGSFLFIFDNCSLDPVHSFRNKVVRHRFIREYINE